MPLSRIKQRKITIKHDTLSQTFVSVHASYKKRAVLRQIESLMNISGIFENSVLAELLADEAGEVITLGMTPHDLEKITVHLPHRRCDVRQTQINWLGFRVFKLWAIVGAFVC